MEPGPPDSKRPRLFSSSSSSHVSLPRPLSTTSPLPPPRAAHYSHHHHHHPPPPYHSYPPRPTDSHSHSSAPPTPVHTTASAPSHTGPDRRHYEPEAYAPMHDHYHHPQHHPPSPAHGSYHPSYSHREPSVVKRESIPEDSHRPNSTGHATDLPSPHPSSTPHHPLQPPPPPPVSYPDSQQRHMGYDNASSATPTTGAYRPPPAYPPPPQTPVASQPSYDQHGSYQPEHYYSVAYSASGVPQKKKNTRASQACDQCRQLKAKCDETKPCKTCRDKGLECKYRDPIPKATDKTQNDILEGIQALSNRFDGQDDRFDSLARTFEDFQSSYKREIHETLSELRQRMSRLEGMSPQVPLKPEIYPDTKTRPNSPFQTNGSAPSAPFFPQEPPAAQTPNVAAAGSDEEQEAEPGPPVPPGEPAIPVNHTTLAGLLLEWPGIYELTRSHIERWGIRYVSEYPISHEQKRGPLIVYGRGEDSRHTRYSRQPSDHGHLSMGDEYSDAASPTSHDFGQVGGLNSPMPEYRGGVLGPDGNPDFSESLVWSYVGAFRKHILNMHPLVPPEEVEQWVQQFLDDLPPVQPRSGKLQVAVPVTKFAADTPASVEATGSKRKRSPTLDESEDPATPVASRAGKPKRSLHSALVLSILALGKVCLHRDKIPDAVHSLTDHHGGSPQMRNGVASPGHSSPPSYSSHHPSAQPSPREQQERGSQSRRPSFHGTSGQRSGLGLKKNYEVIPGLEYFAYATDILGNLSGAYNNIKDVYASVFACLYFGQLNRPLESYSFIHRAGHKLQVIMRPSLDKLLDFKKRNHGLIQEAKYNRLALAFWTCLQLESDLHAELPLPHSGLLSYEDGMPHPNMSLLRGYEQEILDSYLGQLYLRTHLNSIHRMFYAPEDSTKIKSGQDKFQNVELVADAVSGMQWVAPSLKFREEDPPATSILAARLRAKYWGAQVITYRPFIRQILQFTQTGSTTINTEFRDGIVAPAIRPGTKSHSDIEPSVVELAKRGIKALVESTRAFHNLGSDRPIITNIFGTAHAQWGNLLVLSAAFKDPVLGQYVKEDLLKELFHKTIHFFRQSATWTSSLRIDLHILEGLQSELLYPSDPHTGSSFSSQPSMQTPTMAPVTSAPPLTTHSSMDTHSDHQRGVASMKPGPGPPS